MRRDADGPDDDAASLEVEEEDRLHSGLTVFDKITLGAVWAISCVYGVLSEHILGKQVDLPCSVNHDIYTGFGVTSIVLALVLPTLLGPVTSALAHVILSLGSLLLRCPGAPGDTRRQERRNLACISGLTLVFLVTYVLGMVITELYLDLDNVFHFVLLKYIAGECGHVSRVRDAVPRVQARLTT